jgi:hypothetical protein
VQSSADDGPAECHGTPLRLRQLSS